MTRCPCSVPGMYGQYLTSGHSVQGPLKHCLRRERIDMDCQSGQCGRGGPDNGRKGNACLNQAEIKEEGGKMDGHSKEFRQCAASDAVLPFPENENRRNPEGKISWMRRYSAEMSALRTSTPCDVIFTSEELAGRVQERSKVPVVTISSFVKKKEVTQKRWNTLKVWKNSVSIGGRGFMVVRGFYH